jgi:hypothetical protein
MILSGAKYSGVPTSVFDWSDFLNGNFEKVPQVFS